MPRTYPINLCFFLLIFCISCHAEKKMDGHMEKDKPIDEKIDKDDFDISYLMGRFDPSTHPDFIEIDIQYADRSGMFMRKEAYESFQEMYAEAQKENVKLIIRSAARNFDDQKEIWERKWSGKQLVEDNENLAETTPDPKERAIKILKWSSMPGTSRHHWGTDIDLNAFENRWFESGEGAKVYRWLTTYAANFGFCQPYTPKGKERPHGYHEEKWHWSYVPLSGPLLQDARQHLTNEDISGFEGSQTATKIDIKQKYILGVSQLCM